MDQLGLVHLLLHPSSQLQQPTTVLGIWQPIKWSWIILSLIATPTEALWCCSSTVVIGCIECGLVRLTDCQQHQYEI